MDELRDYLVFFKRYASLILVTTLLGAGLGLALAAGTDQYIASGLMFIYADSQSSSGEFTYDHYFVQERARNFTDTALGYLSSKEFQSEVAISAQIKKLAPQLLRVTTISPNQGQANQQLDQFALRAQEKINALRPTQPSLNIIEISSTKEAQLKPRNAHLKFLTGALLGFTLGSVLAAAIAYLTPQKRV